MGLIKTGIQLGGAYAIAKSVTSSLEKHDRERTLRMQANPGYSNQQFSAPPQGYQGRNAPDEYAPNSNGQQQRSQYNQWQYNGPGERDGNGDATRLIGPNPESAPYAAQAAYQAKRDVKSPQGQHSVFNPPPYSSK